ncbi:putative inactive serine protease 54 [Sesbania bispinosa]|nr:putative inactive serine protease 54 [Sesbania bispinosa]
MVAMMSTRAAREQGLSLGGWWPEHLGYDARTGAVSWRGGGRGAGEDEGREGLREFLRVSGFVKL